MKKKIMAMIVGVCMAALLAGCGTSNDIVKIKKYKGLEVEKVEIPVSDEDVEASIRSDLALLGKNVPITDRAAEMGDIVVIDYSGKKDGVAFDGGTAEDQEITLGEAGFIDGFESGIVGHNIGETFDLDLQFPDDYFNDDLAGQAVVFTITLDSIEELPELTVELLPELGTSATTIEEYKKEVREALENSNESSAKASLREAVLQKLVLNCKMKKYPEAELITTTARFVYQESYGAIMSGKNVEQYILDTYGVTVEVKVKEMLMQSMAVKLIADKEGIKVSLEQYEKAVQELAAEYGYSDYNSFVESYESIYGQGYIQDKILEEKVADFLIENCKMVDAK